MYSKSPFSILVVRLYYIDIPKDKWLDYLKTVETLRSAASALGLQCLPVTLLGASSPQLVKNTFFAWRGSNNSIRNKRKNTFFHVCPTKIQMSLRIRRVWSESLLPGCFLKCITVQMRWLIWFIGEHTCPKVLFVALRLFLYTCLCL